LYELNELLRIVLLSFILSRVAARTLSKAGGGTVELARCVLLIDVRESTDILDLARRNETMAIVTAIRRSSRSLSLAKSSKEHVHVKDYTVSAGTLFSQLVNDMKTDAIMTEAKFFSNGISSLVALLSMTSATCESRPEMGIALTGAHSGSKTSARGGSAR